jgi:hypothetical protein
MARARAREILATHFPVHIDEVADQKLRESHDIRLRREVMSI